MEVQVDHDILDRSQSLEASLALNRLWVGPRTFFRLGVETVYQNDQGLQYYYGVSEDEASVTRTTYQPEDGVDLGLSGMFSMKVGEKTTWTAFANWRRFSSEVTESPLVDREDGFFFLTGISWKIR
jgi:outer membrane protein